MGGLVVQMDSGITSSVWGVGAQDYVYTRKNGNWKRIPGYLAHVSTGAAGTWGVNRGQAIYYYTGRNFRRVSGALKQIDSGPPGIVCGVNKNDYIYCRRGVSPSVPYGKSWIKVQGRLKYISCGAFGHWGVNKNNDIFFRYGVNAGRVAGTRWKHVPGKLHQVESGPGGAVWGVNLLTGVYTRLGISRANPVGSKWKRFAKKKLASISVGLGKLYGVDKKGKPFSGEASAFVGKNGLPKRPKTGMLLICLKIIKFREKEF